MKKKTNHPAPILPRLTYTERVSIAMEIKNMLEARPNVYLKSYEILSKLEDLGIKTNPPKIRKMVNYLRCMNIPIISGKDGYAYSMDEQLIIDTVLQLQTRISAMEEAKEGLMNNLKLINAQKINPNAKMSDLFSDLDFI